MGRYARAVWESDAEGPTRRDRLGGVYHPYVPDFIANSEPSLSMDAARACEEAAVALSELDARTRYMATAESLSRILLRSEAISSSRIEGLEMNAQRLLEIEALDELGVGHRTDAVEAQVLANLQAMQEGIEAAARSGFIALEDLLRLHKELLASSRMREYGGKLRQTQNWIGGSWYHPLSAAYVPPQPQLVPALMDDLVAFLNFSRLPAIATAAVAHAQMETIHPFADGNGRMGRAIVHMVLRRSGLCQHAVVPVSLVLATEKPTYVSALSDYRFDEDDPHELTMSEATSMWVEYFAHTLVRACGQARSFEERIGELRNSWQERVHPRADSATRLLLDVLVGNPVVSIASVVRLTGRSYPAARGAVRQLEGLGILVQSSKNRKSGLYVAREVLDEFTRYERSLATMSGDTRVEKPRRPVTQRR